MQIFYGYSDIPKTARGSFAAIGNFDGVHLGHGALFQKAGRWAQARGVPLAALTFEPHPREFFASRGEPFRLMTAGQKHRALEALGVDIIFNLPFDQRLSLLSADDFVHQVLGAGLGLSGVVVGENFAFGAGRLGSVDTLKRHGSIDGFDVCIVPAVNAPDGGPYASSRIRGLLKNGDIQGATSLLGHPWEIEGTVIHGDKRGRELGFPTANQNLGSYVRPLFGIYAVLARIGDDPGARWHEGVSSLGIRPMFRTAEPLLETHIFDFNSDIYGKNISIRPVKFLRPEARYETLDALKTQIRQDCLEARAALKSIV